MFLEMGVVDLGLLGYLDAVFHGAGAGYGAGQEEGGGCGEGVWL